MWNNDIDTISHNNVNVEKHLSKGKQHLNDKVYPVLSKILEIFWMFLRLSDIEIKHTLFDVSSSSSLSRSLCLSKTGNYLWRIKQQWIEHATTP